MHFLCKSGAWLLLPLLSHQAAAQVNVTAPPVPPAQGNQTYQQSQGGYMIPPGQAAGSDLSAYLNALARNPDDVAALTGAGRAALELEDAEAALTFFGRAEELAPNDGRIKAGLGSALSLMEQPESALQFFYQAAQMGVPPAEMAAWRGLAYDLTGDTWRAQQDYQLALRVRENPETRRRLALSQAISGQRDAALTTIDSQLRRQERAAWRVRAFVLALTGDLRGATQVVESMMPDQAAAMAPFLARLPSLSAADRAHAVHFGHFPGNPSAAPVAAAGVGGPLPPTQSATSAGRPDPSQTALGPPRPAAPSVVTPTPIVPAPAVRTNPLPPPVVMRAPPPVSSPVTVAPPPAALAPGFSVQAPTSSAITTATTPPPSAGPIQPPPPSRNLADIATVIARLKDPPLAAKPASKPAPAKPAPPKDPSRKWVQLSQGRNEAGLSTEFRKIRGKAPKLFARQTAWTADEGGSNRLLVGPFKSNKEAQDFVNQLKKEDVRAFSWTSESGQEIKKLPSK